MKQNYVHQLKVDLVAYRYPTWTLIADYLGDIRSTTAAAAATTTTTGFLLLSLCEDPWYKREESIKYTTSLVYWVSGGPFT